MGVATNLEIVQDYMVRMASGNLEGALSLADDAASFQGPDGAVMDKDGLRGLFAMVGPLLINPLDQEIIGTTCEGDRVAIESTAQTLLANGKTYSNLYHFLFVLKDGRIVACREYCNTRAIDAFS